MTEQESAGRGAPVRRVGRVLVGAALGAALGVVAAAPAGAAPAAESPASGCTWTAQALTGLAEGTGVSGLVGWVNGTDGEGRFAGFAIAADGSDHGVIWQDGRVRDFGKPLPLMAEANDVNRLGDAVGYAKNESDYRHAYLWRNGVPIPLAEPAGAAETVATGMNEDGLVVGWGSFPSPDPTAATFHALVWSTQTPDSVRDLGALGGPTQLVGVTDRGRIVGVVSASTEEYAVTGTLRTGLDRLTGTSSEAFTAPAEQPAATPSDPSTSCPARAGTRSAGAVRGRSRCPRRPVPPPAQSTPTESPSAWVPGALL